MPFNHVIDPTYFYDAIEEFAFNYKIYVVTGKTLDELGHTKRTYACQKIRGSLQSQGTRLFNSVDRGNTIDSTYNFYCKSLYRINIGDVIAYHGNYYRVDSVHDYDEWGVRECSLTMVQLTTMRDLSDYIKFLAGEEIV